MWMSGYASRNKPAEGKLHDLWAKALAIRDPHGHVGVLVCLDLVGIPRDLSLEVREHVEKKHGLKRSQIILNASHTHTGPVVRSNLKTMYFLDEKQQQLVDEYTADLKKKIVRAADQALMSLRPAKLRWGVGKATFAVNRRNNRESDVPKLREHGKLKGPVDHDVPVLAVHVKDRLAAIVFGYACHATVLSFYQWSGDYPGFAQLELEKDHPGAVALFWAGCGGDQNPLPRRKVELARKYGRELAHSVNAVLKEDMAPVEGELRTVYREIDLPLAALPTREKLVEEAMSKNRYLAARAKMLLAQLNTGKTLPKSYPYPVQIWKVGNVTWVVLGGEVVVDYSLRLKKELAPRTTWVAGYSNDVMAYIPSQRVLREGGYEGATSMIYYGLPTVWSTKIEEMIVATVHDLAKKVAE